MADFISLLSPPKPPPPPPPQPPPPDLDAVRAEGREEGRRQALADARAEVEAARRALAVLPALVEELTTARKKALDQAAADVVSLLDAALRKVLGDHLVHRPEVLLDIVQGALARIEGEEGVVIRVPPGAADFVRAGLAERHRPAVRADPAVGSGVVVETAHATIEVSLQTMVAGFEQAMRGWLEGGP